MEKKFHVDVIIPVYNEGENIGRTLRAFESQAKRCLKYNVRFTVYIVYDFDEDSTIPAVRKMQKHYPFPIKLTKNPVRGVVNALKTGIAVARGDYILITMADLSDDYSILSHMVDLARKGNDIICPSRYMHGGRLIGGPFLKQLLSRIAGVSAHVLFGVPTHDIPNSYKMYRRTFAQSCRLESTGGFEIGMELVVKAFIDGKRISEIPTTWTDRAVGASRFQLVKWLPKYLRWYWLLSKHSFCPGKKRSAGK